MKQNTERPGLERKASTVDNPNPVDWRLDVLDFLDDPYSGKGAKIFSVFMVMCIVGSVSVFCVATAPRFQQPRYISLFEQCEWGFNLFFTAELAVRLICGRKKLKPIYEGAPIHCPILLFDSFLWFDIISVLPFWVEKAILGDNSKATKFEATLSLLKSFRMFRLFKLARRYQGTIILVKALRRSARALLVPIFFLFVAVVLFGTFIWAAEDVIMKEESRFDSIPHTMWFVVVTMTTVGYGDITPESTVGKMMSVACMLFGLMFLAMPLAIVGTHFSDIWAEKEKVIFLQQLKVLRLPNITHDEMSRIFDDFDVTGDGLLDFHEFESALQKLNIKLRGRQIKKLWSTLDTDKSGTLSKSEFMVLVKDWHYDEGDGDWADIRKNFEIDGTEKKLNSSDSDGKGPSLELQKFLTLQTEMLEKLGRRMERLESKLDSVMLHEAVHDGGGVVHSSLPTGWSAHKDENCGQIFYQHDRSGRVQWERPQEMSTL